MKTYVTVALLVIAVVWSAIFLDEVARDTAAEQAQISTESRSSLPQRKPIPTYEFAKPTPKLFHDVVYRVTTGDYGCQRIEATYEMPSGTAQKNVSICAHAKTAVVDTRTAKSGDFVYLSVQNDERISPIRCEIYVDGSLVFQTESFGQYKIASCRGSVN